MSELFNICSGILLVGRRQEDAPLYTRWASRMVWQTCVLETPAALL